MGSSAYVNPPLATAISPGAVPHYPLHVSDIDDAPALTQKGDYVTHDGSTEVVQHAPATPGVLVDSTVDGIKTVAMADATKLLGSDGSKPAAITLATLAASSPNFMLAYKGTTNSPGNVLDAVSLISAASQAAGGPAITTLACDTLGGFEFEIHGTIAAITGTQKIQINGSDAAIGGSYSQVAIAAGTGSAATFVNAANTLGIPDTIGQWFMFRLTFRNPESTKLSPRGFDVRYSYLFQNSSNTVRVKDFVFQITETAGSLSEITNIALANTTPTMFQAGAVWSFRRLP